MLIRLEVAHYLSDSRESGNSNYEIDASMMNVPLIY
jgi:hypothetical protein